MNFKRKRRSKQLPLPFDEGQKRSRAAERQDFYDTVQYLRAIGYPVYRISGMESRFDGRIVTNDGLRKIAKRLGFGEGQSDGAANH